MDKLGKVCYKMDFKNCSKANTLKPQNGYFYIGINPNDMLKHVTSHQGLHCLLGLMKSSETEI